jgi:formylglycine-generating enzyme required for sulfatase activity
MRAVEAARVAKKRSLILSIVTLSVLLVILAYVVWNFLITNARKLDAQVEIPAGNYMVGSPDEGARATLGAFEIDKYEVSINEYAKFIAWCEKNPDKEHEFDHPRGDRKASHVNDEVKTLILNAFVRGGRVFKSEGNPARGLPADPGAAIDLNSPMVGVTFWDAYAYARWRGKIIEGGAARDLPTEEEWEAAARGKRGFKYPWGEELKVDSFNSNKGYKPLSPGGAPSDDNFNYWAPVDKFTSDESEFKVVGMAGNVLEWVYRKEGSKEIPLLKGGSFASDPIPMWGRVLTIPAEDAWFVWPAANKPKGSVVAQPGVSRYFVGDAVNASVRSLYIGFRTVKRK